ncbi:MAG: NAD(P)H-dependent oxidoreductase subunit E [Clostridia bacterium]|nr:NAD(P)H-dependent oxidoreductase subunit E [Clostridia bacterium]MBQ8332566.1 NAD(P)H-dependent oxidoreductase subunit E [Clostridia bacterium]MBQ8371198.1 NAD(P)H-dependent oxidoreductase subunit E [Clostridia bacterium]MBQ8512823.1 NAD(P)H-dependent oxidoreductase subunit E [Clostridia bacterium]
MKKPMTSVAFKGTPEQLAALDAVIAAHKDQAGCLMPILQKAQDIYGYLPEEVQRHIALALDIPFSEVFGVVTFYAQFLLNPKGTNPVAVCLGTACYVKGSGILMDKLETLLGISNGGITEDLKFSLEATRCIGACGLAPVLTIGEDVYGRLEPNMLEGILAKYN